jgi:hypothetical protein
LENSWAAELLAASQGRLSSKVELVILTYEFSQFYSILWKTVQCVLN